MVGFIFVPGTPRALDPETATWIREIVGVETVGVFRDAPRRWICEVVAQLKLSRVQLHGREPDDWVTKLGVPVIRRVPVRDESVDRARVERILGLGALPLVDPGGGDGVPCDWRGIGATLEGLEFGLAGGLRPSNVAQAIVEARPSFVDVSSGVEAGPRTKSSERIGRFIRLAREAAAGVQC